MYNNWTPFGNHWCRQRSLMSLYHKEWSVSGYLDECSPFLSALCWPGCACVCVSESSIMSGEACAIQLFLHIIHWRVIRPVVNQRHQYLQHSDSSQTHTGCESLMRKSVWCFFFETECRTILAAAVRHRTILLPRDLPDCRKFWLLSGENVCVQVGRRTWLCVFDPKTDGCSDMKDSQKFKEFLQDKYEKKKWWGFCFFLQNVIVAVVEHP